MQPQISVVVPSFNRRVQLLRLLETLALQTLEPGQFEVIIVLDGSTDGSAEAARAASWPFRLEVIEQANAGPGAARNTGAARAQGAKLAFIDDDLQLSTGALSEHVRALDAHPRSIAVGRVECQWLNHGMGQRGEGYWEHFESLDDGAGLTFRDCYGCNFSISHADFYSLEGFYSPMRRLEDVELGFRAVRAGMPIVFAREAAGIHDVMKSPAGALRDAFDTGAATMLAWRTRPDFITALAEGFRRPQRRAVSRLVGAVVAVPIPNRLAWWIGRQPEVPGIRTLHTLLWYRWYLRGVRSAASNVDEFYAFLGR